MPILLSFLTQLVLLFSPENSFAADMERFRYKPERNYIERQQRHPSFRRHIVRGRWSSRNQRYTLERSNERELQDSLRGLPWTDVDRKRFSDTREMTAIGLSASGILYLIPEQNIFFWEEDDSKSKHSNRTLLSPVVSNFINDMLVQLHRDIASNQGRALGSAKAGSFFMFILNPAQSIGESLNRASDRNIFKEGHTQLLIESPHEDSFIGSRGQKIKSNYIGLHFQLVF